MRYKLHTTMFVAVGVLLALVTLVPVRSDAQVPTARVVSVEGVTRKFQVRDWDGKLVEVEVPSQSFLAIQGSNGEQRGTNSGMARDKDTMMATVVAVDRQDNRVKVQTEEGKTIVLDMPAGDIQVGEKIVLMVP